MKLPSLLDDLFENAPRSPGERSRRWEATRRAVASTAPHVLSGGIACLCARDLRIVTTAIDLHFFHTAFQATFDYRNDIQFAWRIDERCPAGEASTEQHSGPDGDLFEFVLHRRVASTLLDRHLADIHSLDGGRCRDAVDLVLLILARCMLRVVSVLYAPRSNAIESFHLELLGRLLPLDPVNSE